MNLWQKFLYHVQGKPIPKEVKRNEKNLAAAKKFYYVTYPYYDTTYNPTIEEGKFVPSGSEDEMLFEVNDDGLYTGRDLFPEEMFDSELDAIQHVIEHYQKGLEHHTNAVTKDQQALYKWEQAKRNYPHPDQQG